MSHDLSANGWGCPPDRGPPTITVCSAWNPASPTGLIERRVHQRRIRCANINMAHPEQATEAMNRLAQAYVCLTDPATKQPYDAALLGGAAPAAAMTAVAEARKSPSDMPDPLAWLFGPATLCSPTATPPPLPRLPSLPPAQTQTLAPSAEPELCEPVDPLTAAARESKPARAVWAPSGAVPARCCHSENAARWGTLWEHIWSRRNGG